ncbi:type II toxin-antitoxin system RelE/ParE family toxin [Pseudomonas syringae]|uniref:type II toxin-antitoxin system RelE/ParE family toxin n=1 Tax=Pseudomonas syringae TaxID=317 RepID=UPI0018E60D6B|nr:type II toxin-antitoxin system RelE/ParE family toxin [Pseudomonas syringae]MBI6794982.1 type II toxin-antitoxin system RelE/ParE family toxin [Pseudomonas syringae]
MLPVVWLSPALDDLREIATYIAWENPGAARRLKKLLQDAIEPVAEHPYLYRSGRVPGTRELVAHPNYVLVYRVTLERIEVVNVIHARQEYPSP